MSFVIVSADVIKENCAVEEICAAAEENCAVVEENCVIVEQICVG